MKISRRLALCAGVTATTLVAGGGAAVWAGGSAGTASRVVASSALRIASISSLEATTDSAPAPECTSVHVGVGFPGPGGPAVPPAVPPGAAELPADVVERINADTKALIDFLHDHGVDVATTTDDQGVTVPDIPASDEVARLVEQYVTEKFGALPLPPLAGAGPGGAPTVVVGGAFPGGAGEVIVSSGAVGDTIVVGSSDLQPPEIPEEIRAQIEADNQGLLEAFTAKGIDATIVEGPGGLGHVEWDFTDEAANAVAQEYFSEHGGSFGVSVAAPVDGSLTACAGGPTGVATISVTRSAAAVPATGETGTGG